MRWDGETRFALFQEHLQRMAAHARRLDLPWPRNAEQSARQVLIDGCRVARTGSPTGSVGLVRLNLTANGEWSCRFRWRVSVDAKSLSAITISAPRWNRIITGTKHGDWSPYQAALHQANHTGADVALLVHDGVVVDADMATPIACSDNGVVWIPDPRDGGVESVSVTALRPELAAKGYRVHTGRLLQSMITDARCLIIIGSGVGVARIGTVDGQSIGTEQNTCFLFCREIMEDVFRSSWIDLG